MKRNTDVANRNPSSQSFGRSSGDGGGERASALPLLVVCVVLVGAFAVGLARLGAVAVRRAQAQTAADAAALAGAAAGRPAAEELTQQNGGVLVAYATSGTDVEVVVRVGDAIARARARRDRIDPFRPRPRRTLPGEPESTEMRSHRVVTAGPAESPGNIPVSNRWGHAR